MTFLVVVRRELRRLVFVPQTYVIAACFLAISGLFFLNILISSKSPDLADYYSNISSTLIVLAPIVAMRSVAEERMTGALNLTLSWPLSRTGLVLGKFVANTLYTWMLVSIAWLYVRLLSDLTYVDGARVTGGYIGMLLLSMAFNGVALMVSTRATSTAGAAFGGFGLLLFLWILQYAPGWLKALSRFGPTPHLAPMQRGVLHISDFAYFLTITAVALLAAVQAFAENKPGPRRRSLIRTLASLSVGAVVLLLMPTTIEDLRGTVDLTGTLRNTVSKTTRDVLHRVSDPITLKGFVQPHTPEAAKLVEVVKRYRAAGARIRLNIIDPDAQPGLAGQEGITNYSQYVLQVGDRREPLQDINEISLTSAISRMGRSRAPRACFVVGHGERDVTDDEPGGLSSLGRQLRILGYEYRPVALGAPGGVEELDRCDVVLVMGPQSGFLPSEVAILEGFIRANGRLILAADGAEGAEQWNELLAPWGLRFRSQIVADNSSLADDPFSVVAFDYPSQSPIVSDLTRNNIPVVVTRAVAIERTGATVSSSAAAESDSAGFVVPLVRSSPRSWTGQSSGVTSKGPFILAATADGTIVTGTGKQAAQHGARVAVLGSAELATNRWSGVMGNQRFMTALVQWVGMENDLVTAYRDPGTTSKLILTAGQKSRMIRQSVVLPTLSVLVLLPLTVIRLRRG